MDDRTLAERAVVGSVVVVGMIVAPRLLVNELGGLIGAPAQSATPADHQPFDWTPLLWGAAGIVVLIAAVVAVYAVRNNRRRRGLAHETQRQTRDAQQQRWEAAMTVWNGVRESVTAFEIDPTSIFGRPLLGDVTEPATAAFWESYERAESVCLDRVPRDDKMIAAFAAAATAARTAFEVADANARRKATQNITAGNRKLDRDERRRLGLARKVMAVAFDPRVSAGESSAARERLLDLLDGIIVVPDRLTHTLTKAIDTRRQLALTPPPR